MMTQPEGHELDVLRALFPSQPEALRFVGHQINVVDSMATQLNTLAGILLAVTTAILSNLTDIRFSARVLVVVGTLLVLGSIIVNAVSVFRLRWITQYSPPEYWAITW
jgi:hypothetical protein